jgi:glycosyltransferase involved in cell wall biosynthesis
MAHGVSARLWFIDGQDIRLRLPLLLELRARGFDVAAVGAEEVETFAQHEIPYFKYGLKWDLSPLADLRGMSQLYRLFRRHRPDLIHAFHTKPGVYAPLAAKKAGIKGIVRTVTGLGHLFSSRSPLAVALRPLYRRLQRLASEASSVTVFQNEEDREFFLTNGMVRPGRETLIRSSGVDLRRLKESAPSPAEIARLRNDLGLNGHLVVTMVSRLLRHKGVGEFLQAGRLVRASRPDVVFLLVGPAHENEWKGVPLSQIRESADAVRYLGRRDDIPALLALSDVFVLPSYYREGVPRVLLEAGAMGLPLITTDMPGCRDVVKDGWNGLLVPPRDGATLSRAVLRLLAARDERALMGARSRRLVFDEYGLERVAEAQAEIYERLLKERGQFARLVPGLGERASSG